MATYEAYMLNRNKVEPKRLDAQHDFTSASPWERPSTLHLPRGLLEEA